MEIQKKDGKIFAPLKDKWLVDKPEELVRQNYICRLVNNYGFSLEQMAQEITTTEASSRGTGTARADIVIWSSSDDKINKKRALIVVECKAEYITIHQEDYFQGFNYASWMHAKFLVTTNQKETRIFKLTEDTIPQTFVDLKEIADIPSAKDANDEKAIKKILNQTKSFTRDEFSKLLSKCHDIIRDNDKLSPEAAFDEISKILFIKVRYERDNNEGQIFSKERFIENRKAYEKLNKEMGITDAIPFYQNLFERTKQQFANDHLFDDNAKIEIRENSFEQIVKELQIYNLSTTSDDVKGLAFEKFLGTTFRGELGQFFTPRTIVNFMVSVIDPQEGELVCDPCCGSGGFLIKAFEYVREHIEEDIKIQKKILKDTFFDDDYEKLSNKQKVEVEENIEKIFTVINEELNINNNKGRLRSLSFNCIYGTDANPRMARTAKMNMIMHGDGHGGVHHHDGLLNVNGIFENRFDVILTNPPFGSRVEKDSLVSEADRFTDQEKIAKYKERYGLAYEDALKQVNSNIGKSILGLYETGKICGLTEVLFIERCLNLLKPGGRMAIVLPEGVLNNSNLQRVRDFVEQHAKIILIVSIPQDVFMASGATVKPSLLFFKKFTEEEQKEFIRIKDDATKEINEKYKSEIDGLYETIKKTTKGLSKELKDIISKNNKTAKAKLKEIEVVKEQEIKQLVKKRFDYEIPFAEVKNAGIDATGNDTEDKNELRPLEKEFIAYCNNKHLWNKTINSTSYKIFGDDVMRIRVTDGIASKPEIFYTKQNK
ncbi:N-6 DNA methylase [Xylanibacter oryzae]|uniref:N-6 DNA methylase n=1 Tax=Xylanibacter oryzae TaxID=185293 RepID=UPI0004BA230B|nr:N-6 DNA methylase [Xylanibacter oryzae]